jgi:hypothetical protein
MIMNSFKWMLAASAAAMITMSGSAAARELDPNKPEEALEIMKRTQCGEADGVPAVYHWSGRVYGRRQGEPDKLLFAGEGMNIRQCVAVSDPVRGNGYRQVSREIMLMLDPETGEVLREWENPYTGETVKVLQIANDPVNGRPSFPMSADGKPYKLPNLLRQGDWLFMPIEVPLFYDNVLAGDYQDYVGNKYHAMEIFDFTMRASEILDPKAKTAYPAVSWVRISDWMPWMKMRGRQGQVVFNAMGAKLKSFDELPDVLKDEIALNYPKYTAAPPGDDARPNETTWTVFKEKLNEGWDDLAEKPATSGH